MKNEERGFSKSPFLKCRFVGVMITKVNLKLSKRGDFVMSKENEKEEVEFCPGCGEYKGRGQFRGGLCNACEEKED